MSNVNRIEDTTAQEAALARSDLVARLLEMEAVVAALRDHQVDAIVGESDVALVHLRQVEEALRESGERYRAFVSNSSEGIWRYEMDPPMPLALSESEQVDYIFRHSVLAECNDAMARLAGYERASDLTGQPGFGGESDPMKWAMVEQFVRSGYRISYLEMPDLDRHGERRWLGMSCLGIPKDGKLSRIWGVQRDVTARREAEEELQQRTIELRALLAITRDLAGTLDLKPLLENLLSRLRTVFEFTGALVGMLDGDQAVVAAYDGPLPAETVLHLRVPSAGLLPLGELITTRQAMILDDIRITELVSPEVWSAIALRLPGITVVSRSWLMAPLVAKNQVIGVLVLNHLETGRFTRRQGELAEAFADHAAVAIENARLYGEARQLAALNERQRLAAELHDSVSQAIYSISLAAHTGLANLDRRPEHVRMLLNHILGLADAAFTDIRSLIFELRPESLARHGLVTAIERQAEGVHSREKVQVYLELGREPQVPIGVKEALYRIAQESMNNIVKHARAKTVWLRLAVEGAELCLEIRDDGKGFDPSVEFAGHLGLRLMRERAQQLGGTLTITSAPRAGTAVIARVPLTPS
jgi:signal transduction histidine kinase